MQRCVERSTGVDQEADEGMTIDDRTAGMRSRQIRSRDTRSSGWVDVRRRSDVRRLPVHARPARAGAHRRHQREQARGIEVAQRKAWMERRRAEVEAVKAEQRSAGYLPRGGEKGPAALRSYRRLKVQPHRATSDVLAGAYPFLAEAGLGSDGVFIGTDSWSGAAFVYDPWVLYEQGVLTNPNQLLAGVIGKGKSMLAKSLATRSIAFGRKVYVPGDPKGEWSVVMPCRRRSGHRTGRDAEHPAEPTR